MLCIPEGERCISEGEIHVCISEGVIYSDTSDGHLLAGWAGGDCGCGLGDGCGLGVPINTPPSFMFCKLGRNIACLIRI